MIKLRACPKCRGDLYLNQDMYGKYLNCLQCGYLKDLTGRPETEVREPEFVGEGRKAA